MGWLDRLLGRDEGYGTPTAVPQYHRTATAERGAGSSERTSDDIAVERYRYLLRTAPPETIEQVHLEAFTKLSTQQRALLFQQLSENAPAGERPVGDDPAALAQSATRSELRQPGTMERTLRGNGGTGGGMGGPSFGSMMASSLLGTVAGYVIGSALVSAFLPTDLGSTDASADAGSADGTDASGVDFGADSGADSGGDFSGDGFGGGFGSDGASDFGGGDFGADAGGFDFGGGFDF